MGATNAKDILIIEDSPDLQDLLGQLFTSEGYKLSQAFNGKQALDMLRTMPQLPSIILLDIMMPVMDGFEFRKIQLSEPRLAAVPVVVMTADSNSQARASHFSVETVIRKPIQDLDKLLEITDRICASAS